MYLSSVSWKIIALYFFISNNIYFAQKQPIKMKIFETFECSGQNLSNSLYQFWNDKLIPLQNPIKILILSGPEKIYHIPHVIFQTTGQLKVMLVKSVNNVLGKGMYMVFRQKKPIEFQLFGLSTACLKLSKFLIWFLKSGISFV